MKLCCVLTAASEEYAMVLCWEAFDTLLAATVHKTPPPQQGLDFFHPRSYQE